MKRLYLLFLLSTMGMLTSYAQHTKKHKVQQKTAVTQPVQTKSSVGKEQKQASAKGHQQSVKAQSSQVANTIYDKVRMVEAKKSQSS